MAYADQTARRWPRMGGAGADSCAGRREPGATRHSCPRVWTRFPAPPGTPGRDLPSHVREMEAECYAHQAFRHHGMRMPKAVTAFGRRYVGEWVEHDRAVGVPIDPRAVAYANGELSPLEPLRDAPRMWSRAIDRPDEVRAGADAAIRRGDKSRNRVRELLGSKERPARDTGMNGWAVDVTRRETRFWVEASDWFRYALHQASNGFLASALLITAGSSFGCPPDWCAPQSEFPSMYYWALAVMGAVIWANTATLVRTLKTPFD